MVSIDVGDPSMRAAMEIRIRNALPVNVTLSDQRSSDLPFLRRLYRRLLRLCRKLFLFFFFVLFSFNRQFHRYRFFSDIVQLERVIDTQEPT